MDAATLTSSETADEAQDQAVDRFAVARDTMVDSQLRPNKIVHPGLLAAMRQVPRESFLPADRQPVAYFDADIRLGGGRFLLAPLTIARLIQAVLPAASGGKVLVVGASTGYSAAILALCGQTVVALESDTAQALYDAIIIEGAVTAIPQAIAAQLKPGSGRLATVLLGAGGVGQLVVVEGGGAATPRPICDASAPILAALEPKSGFVF